MTLDALKAEYDHTMQRSEKLDTKVSLLLTAVAFIFAFSVMDIISVSDIDISTAGDNVLLVIYIIVTVLVFLGYILQSYQPPHLNGVGNFDWLDELGI